MMLREKQHQLEQAIKMGDVESIRQLVKQGANINGLTAAGLPVMCLAKDEAILRILVGLGADVNLKSGQQQETWLHSAALGSSKEISLLLDLGANPNAKMGDGETPLFSAVHAGRLNIIELLIKHGADVNIQRNDGWTALHCAIIGMSYAIATKLILSGADLSLTEDEEHGDTPLIFATTVWDVSEVDFYESLLEYDANVNLTARPDGFGPIHFAAYHGFTELVPLLHRYNADLSRLANDGRSPIQIAQDRKHFETADVITQLVRNGT